jgi:hypothetical protein
VPACYWLVLAFTFKQFLSAALLRIFPIQNLVPRTALALCDVTCSGPRRDYL